MCEQLEQFYQASGVVEACAGIGVGKLFVRNGRPPEFDDDGLRERLAAIQVPSGGLLIVGPVGSHKTHLVCARAVRAAYRGYDARVVTWPTVLREVRHTFRHDARETELDVVNRYADLDYLAIDEIGMGRDGREESEFALGIAYALIDTRYERKLITDFTCNLRPEELAERFDERIARRINEMTVVYPMLLDDVVH